MRVILLIFFLLIARFAEAQTTITGSVLDKKGEPIIGANVSIKGTYDGASSNIKGVFTFITAETGDQVILVSFIGYKPFSQNVNINGSTITVSSELVEEINRLDAVLISAGSFNADDEGRREVLKALDIATTAGATADIAGALNTLPGTQKVGETGRLFVRGGEGYETKTFIDGIQVMNAYSASAANTPGRGRFSPFMFKGTSFSTGGYSAEYGQALSSALILDTKDLVAIDRVDIGLMTVGGDIGVSKAWDKSSMSAKLEYTNIAPYFALVEQKIDWKKAPKSVGANYAYRIKTSKSGMLKFYGNYNRSGFTFTDTNFDNNPEIIDLDNQYSYWNASYKEIISDKMSLRTGLSYTSLKEEASRNSDQLDQTDEGLHAKVVFNYDVSDKLVIKSGGELFTHQFDETLTDAGGNSLNLGFNDVLTATFVEAELYTSNNFVTRVGSRLEHSTLTDQLRIEPRASLGYKTGEFSQVSLAYGQFQQHTETDILKVANDLETEKANHYILNYQRINNRRTFRVEAYYKQYRDLVKYSGTNIYDASTYNNSGEGYGRGIDVFWRDSQTFKNTDYWVSYSFLDTERDYRNYPSTAVPSFASSHNFSVVYKRFITSMKSQLGLTYSFASGRYFHNPNQEGFQNGTTRSYQDLSANISYLYRPHIIVHASVTNVLGRENVFGYEYANTPDDKGVYQGRAIGQSAPRFIFLGIFITLSKNSNVNQLRNL